MEKLPVMTEKNTMQLKDQLLSLGFETLVSEVDFSKAGNQNTFTIYHAKQISDDQLMYVLFFEKNYQQNFVLTQYHLGIRHIPIPELIIGGINTRELEGKIIKAEELREQFSTGKADKSQDHLIKDADDDLMQLMNKKGRGREIAKLLIFKHWPEEEWERFIKDEKSLREKYEAKLEVAVKDGQTLTADQAYEVVKKKVTTDSGTETK